MNGNKRASGVVYNHDLTLQEHKISEAVVYGLPNGKIAEILRVVEGVVSNQITTIFKKMKVRNRVELALAYNYCYGPFGTEVEASVEYDYNLTELEHEICKAIVNGDTNIEIAEKLGRDEGAVSNQITQIFRKMNVKNRVELAINYFQRYEPICSVIEMIKPILHNSPSLRLGETSNGNLPVSIPLTFQGKPFVIGRQDIRNLIGGCDFEFPRDTKGVSHRHASIDHTSCGYYIKDLKSKAGTFVNGERITPNEACMIQQSGLISFGNYGVDYVFEAYQRRNV